MYQPAPFREDHLPTLHALIRAHPLATLITAGAGGLQANLVPFLLAEDGLKGTLRAHIARANEQAEALREGAETLVVFQGPESYISPSWYASKEEHGRVVPTWNYVAVQVRGTPNLIEDARWLRAHVEALTSQQEDKRSAPWKVSDAPESFIAGLIGGILGIEIAIEHIEGKWKASQNRSAADRYGVKAGLRTEGGNEEMAGLVTRGLESLDGCK